MDAVVVVPPDLADVSNVQPPPFSVRRAPGDAQELVFDLAPPIELPIARGWRHDGLFRQDAIGQNIR